MVVSIDNENIICDTFEEYRACINVKMELDSAEIWISENGGQDDLPCLGILINDDEVVINYFGEDGRNYVTVGHESDEREISFCAGQYDVAGYQIIDKTSAIKGILDFFDSKDISDHLRWEEL